MTSPDEYVELESLTITKALNADGDMVLVTEKTEGLSCWEAIGMCVTTADTLRKALVDVEE